MLLEALMSSDLINLEALTSVCRENLVKIYHSEQGPAQSKARKVCNSSKITVITLSIGTYRPKQCRP